MNSLSLSPAVNVGGEGSSFVSGSYFHLQKSVSVAERQKGPFSGISGAWLRQFGHSKKGSRRSFYTVARIKKGQKHEYPWPEDIDPNLKNGHLSYLSHFKPLTEKPKTVTLEFEKQLVELEKKIIDVRKMADETGLDFSDQINLLESKYQQAIKDLYTHLTPIQRLNIARHPNRPTFLDHILNITDKWVELHGDRAGYDDPAIVTGLGSINGKTYMFIGHQKGRNTKENIQRNFGMPTPHGYRKALRMMRYADHHGLPIVTFIDTPGAFADLKSEELGQGEAIAFNLKAMFGFKVPIVTVVIGEGGSGGALAIGCANKLYMMENSVFYVASPEACAAILWKTSQAAPKAAEKLKITATELCKLKIADGIIPEPLGGAHTDPTWTSQQIKITITKAMEELEQMGTDRVLEQRHMKFRILGGFVEGEPVEPERKRNMKKKEIDVSKTTADIEMEIQSLKKAVLEANGNSPVSTISDETIEKLKLEIDKEMTNAFIAMGLQEKLESLKMDISKSSDPSTLNPALKERVDRLVQEFQNNLSRPGSYMELKQKLGMLEDINRLLEQKTKGQKLKNDINVKLREQVRNKMELLKIACEKLEQGEELDDDQIDKLEETKDDLAGMFESANLEVIGFGKKKDMTARLGLEKKIAKADEITKKEIEKAIDVAGLRGKVDELKAEILSGHKEKVENLNKEIREGIAAVIDLDELKAKVKNAMESPVEEALGTAVGTGNSR